MTDCCSSKQLSLYSISTTPGNPGNLREFEIAPGNTGNLLELYGLSHKNLLELFMYLGNLLEIG